MKFLLKEYGNVDCNTVQLETIGNKTIISWVQPDFNVDYFQVKLNYESKEWNLTNNNFQY
jgi:hypothetical protein